MMKFMKPGPLDLSWTKKWDVPRVPIHNFAQMPPIQIKDPLLSMPPAIQIKHPMLVEMQAESWEMKPIMK